VRWDAELEQGVQRRVLASRAPGQEDAGFGPTFDVSGHLALVPLARVGLYLHYDGSPVSSADTRDLVSGGLDGRLGFPLGVDLRGYLRIALGAASTFAAAHAAAGANERGFVSATQGYFGEVPLALGLIYRVSRGLALTGEVATRIGFGFSGPAYGAGGSGEDVLAVGFDLGVAWGR
jgi:hypothetical protein